MPLDDGDELIESIEVTDIELSSYMAAEKARLKELGKNISILMDKVNHLKSEYEYCSNSMWQKAFTVMPHIHPANYENVDKLEFNVESHKIELIKKAARQGR